MKRTEEEREQMYAFARTVDGSWCAVCGFDETLSLDAHHVVSKQELRNRGRLDLLWDVRNALALCAIGGYGNDCHERHENASRRVPLSALTQENLEFATEVLGDGAEYYLARRYAPSPQATPAGARGAGHNPKTNPAGVLEKGE